MKPSELSFADMAALELLPAVINHWSFLNQPSPEAGFTAAARYTYGQADALAAERDRRNNIQQQIVDTLRARLERAEASYSMVLNMNEDGQFGARVALSEVWEFLGVKDQTAAMQALRDLSDGIQECLTAERARKADLKPGAPASQYTAARIEKLERLVR